MEDKSKIHISSIINALWSKRKVFFIIWPITFVLSCIIIFPQPRYYTCEVAIAPESSDGSGGGLSSLASSFGINLGGMESSDAIYPELYPDLFNSTDFTVSLLNIKVKTFDDSINTDYYDYLKNHQKKNIWFEPFYYLRNQINKIFREPEIENKGRKMNPFMLSRKDYDLVQDVQKKIQCQYSKTTGVVSISVQDQDPLVSALLADSVKERLQNFITDYRTKKARIDFLHYEKLVKEAKIAYDRSLKNYSSYYNSHRKAIDQTVISGKEDELKEVNLKYQAYSALAIQLQAAEAKIQERTPAFTTLQSATVPVKPSGPKRMIFVAVMLILSTFATIGWLYHKELIEWF